MVHGFDGLQQIDADWIRLEVTTKSGQHNCRVFYPS